MAIPRVATIAALYEPEGLTALLGPVAEVSRAPLDAGGLSGATLERLDVRLQSGQRRRLVLKRSRPAQEWLARRTGDAVGREVALLGEPAFAGVWDTFSCPYHAFAAAAGEIGLLMDDLTGYLVSPEDVPISATSEGALLVTLAAMHARYWDAPALRHPWLAAPVQLLTCVAPTAPADAAARAAAPQLMEWVRQGWVAALSRLPAAAGALLTDAAALTRVCAGLPPTLLHGDARLVNFAFLPGGQVGAFDWQFVAAGPATLDLGFYLIGNPRRRARAPELALDRYRTLLEAALGHSLGDGLWERLVAAAVLYGASFLLWDRALDLEDNVPGAAAEWNWWVRRLLLQC